jgi:hypothetical protein
MNCAQHADRPVAAYCRTCGKALCEPCKREIRGFIYCEDCLASRVQPAAWAPAAVPPYGRGGPHPGMAFLLALLLPFGVAPVYNGLYARGLAYLVVFVALISGLCQGGSASLICGIGLAAFYFWQIIDSVRSARYLQMGLAAPDPFGTDRLFGGPTVPGSAGAAPSPWTSAAPFAGAPVQTPPPPPVHPAAPPGDFPYGHHHSHIPLYALLLIVLGVMFLLDNMGLHWAHEYWPVVLIVIGGWLLAARWGEISSGTPGSRYLVMAPALWLTGGIAFLLDRIYDISIWEPALLIVVGLVLVWRRTVPPGKPSEQQPER